MARAKEKSQPAILRRLTRQGLREAYAQFSNLPLEVVRMIATTAAKDNVASNTKWVAQSLALVCREFRDVVEPVLVDTVRVTDTNFHAIVNQNQRFARTRRTLLYFDTDHDGLGSFYSGQLAYQATLHPIISTVRVSYPRRYPPLYSYLLSLSTVTHLHLRYCPLWVVRQGLTSFMPMSVTHLIVDPLGSDDHESVPSTIINGLTVILQERPPNVLRRLLVRPMFTDYNDSRSFIERLARLATSTRDARLWVDDTMTFDSRRSLREEDIARLAEDEDQDVALWYSGRQLLRA